MVRTKDYWRFLAVFPALSAIVIIGLMIHYWQFISGGPILLTTPFIFLVVLEFLVAGAIFAEQAKYAKLSTRIAFSVLSVVLVLVVFNTLATNS